MVCSQYDALTIVDKTKLIGKAVHMIQSSEKYFQAIKKLITEAEAEDLFKDIKILPDGEKG